MALPGSGYTPRQVTGAVIVFGGTIVALSTLITVAID
jgi:hypothetical protein